MSLLVLLAMRPALEERPAVRVVVICLLRLKPPIHISRASIEFTLVIESNLAIAVSISTIDSSCTSPAAAWAQLLEFAAAGP